MSIKHVLLAEAHHRRVHDAPGLCPILIQFMNNSFTVKP